MRSGHEGRRQYKHPPIDEAICEIRFAPSSEWDLTVPGRFHAEIKTAYAGKPEQQKVELEAGFQVGDQTSGQLKLKQGIARVKFPTLDGRRLLSVGPDLIGIHLLRPYPPGWLEDFRPRIAFALDAYRRLFEPVGLRRVGVRYINRIVVPSERFDLGEYFTAPITIPDGLPTEIGAFLTRIESAYNDSTEESPIRLVLTFATLKEQAPEKAAFLLDIDVIQEWPKDPLSLELALERIDDLRPRERVAFEALITENARELFDAA